LTLITTQLTPTTKMVVSNYIISFSLWMSLLLLLCSCNTTETPDATAEKQEVVASPAEIPLVTLHTATTGRLALRRQANGKLRARREIVVKSRAGGLVTEAPQEGTYYKDGSLLLATEREPLELTVKRAKTALDEANFKHEDLLLRLTMNLPPGDTSVTDLARRNIRIQSGLPAAEVSLTGLAQL
jgi:hypothetical protein